MAMIDSKLKETSAKIQNLLRVAESGVYIETIVDRMLELEAAEKSLQSQRAALEQSYPYLGHTSDEIQSAVLHFLRIFEEGFDEMPLPDKKAALRKMIDTILVDREAGKVRCYFRRLPSVDAHTRICSMQRSPSLDQTCSLKPNLLHPEGDFIITELDLA